MKNNGDAEMVTDNPMGEIRTRVGKIWLREDGIVHLVIDPGTKYTLADTRESSAGIVKLSEGQRRPLLADARDLKSVDLAARNETAAFEEVMAAAMLIDSAVSRMIGNIFLSTKKTSFPVRLFTSEAEAVEWLKEFLE
jgi:hypothetical protein